MQGRHAGDGGREWAALPDAFEFTSGCWWPLWSGSMGPGIDSYST